MAISLIYIFLMDHNCLVSLIDQLLLKTGDMAFGTLETSGGTSELRTTSLIALYAAIPES